MAGLSLFLLCGGVLSVGAAVMVMTMILTSNATMFSSVEQAPATDDAVDPIRSLGF